MGSRLVDCGNCVIGFVSALVLDSINFYQAFSLTENDLGLRKLDEHGFSVGRRNYHHLYFNVSCNFGSVSVSLRDRYIIEFFHDKSIFLIPINLRWRICFSLNEGKQLRFIAGRIANGSQI